MATIVEVGMDTQKDNVALGGVWAKSEQADRRDQDVGLLASAM